MAPRSLCHTTAIAPVPAFLGRSCPLGCSLSAPATGGLSMVSPQYIRYAAGSEKEKRAGGRLHGGTIAQSFLFCNRAEAEGLTWTECPVAACALLQRKVWLGMGRYPPAPPSNVLRNRGTRCTPGGGAAPCTLLGGGRRRRLLTWRVGTILVCPRTQGLYRPGTSFTPVRGHDLHLVSANRSAGGAPYPGRSPQRCP